MLQFDLLEVQKKCTLKNKPESPTHHSREGMTTTSGRTLFTAEKELTTAVESRDHKI